jgi:hypothetical protein
MDLFKKKKKKKGKGGIKRQGFLSNGLIQYVKGTCVLKYI